MSQIQWTVSLVLASLFTIAIIGFAVNFAIDNDASVNIIDDPELNTLYTKAQGNQSGFNTGSEDTYASIINSSISPTSASGTTTTAGQFSITPVNMIGVVTNILSVGYSKVFGSDSGFELFLGTFLSMILLITGLYIWKTWAGRSPD
jgi:hypothetical protein